MRTARQKLRSSTNAVSRPACRAVRHNRRRRIPRHAAIGYAAPANGVTRRSIAASLDGRTDETIRRNTPSAIPSCVGCSGINENGTRGEISSSDCVSHMSATLARRTVAVATLLSLCGCVPIPIPASVTTRETPPPLPAPLSPQQSIVLSGSAADCIAEGLSAMTPPIRLAAPELLPQDLRSLTLFYGPSADERAKILATPEAKQTLEVQKIAYAVHLSGHRYGGCDFNFGIAAGGYEGFELRARIFELSGNDLGEAVVNAGGTVTGIGLAFCGQNSKGAVVGILASGAAFREDRACSRMAEELHRYFTSAQP